MRTHEPLKFNLCAALPLHAQFKEVSCRTRSEQSLCRELQQMPGSDKLDESHKMQMGDFFFSQAFTEIYFPGIKRDGTAELYRGKCKDKGENPIFFLSNPIKPTISFHNSFRQYLTADRTFPLI